jgi:hypothetical protein
MGPDLGPDFALKFGKKKPPCTMTLMTKNE